MEIKRLPTDVRAVIRSGYNVSTFAQCVNELVFNALDAQSQNIAIRINLVTFRIQVVDDGEGITAENLDHVGRRHFSHKCHTLDEFDNNIKYFGYKGEALASIAANALKVTIASRCRSKSGSQSVDAAEKTYQKRIDHDGHSQVNETNARASHGTTVTIEQFLHNLPVRQKRTKQGEFTEIQRNLKLIFMVHPNVNLSLRDDSSTHILLATNAVTSIKCAMLQQIENLDANALKYYSITKGRTIAKIMLQLKRHDSNKHQLLFINKQPISSASLKNCLNQIIRQSSFASEGDLKAKKTDPFVYLVTISCPRTKYTVVGANEVEFKHVEGIINLLQRLVTKCLQKEKCLPTESIEKKKRKERENFAHAKFSLGKFPGAYRANAIKEINLEKLQEESFIAPAQEAVSDRMRKSQNRSSHNWLSNAIAVSITGSASTSARDMNFPSFIAQANYFRQNDKVQPNEMRDGMCDGKCREEYPHQQEHDEKFDASTEIGKHYMMDRFIVESRTEALQRKARQPINHDCRCFFKYADSNRRHQFDENLIHQNQYHQSNQYENRCRRRSADFFESKHRNIRQVPEYRRKASDFQNINNVFKNLKLPRMSSMQHLQSKPQINFWDSPKTFPNYIPPVFEFPFSPVKRQPVLKMARKSTSERKRSNNHNQHPFKLDVRVQRNSEKRSFFDRPIFFPSNDRQRDKNYFDPQPGSSRNADFTLPILSNQDDFPLAERKENMNVRNGEYKRDFFRIRASEKTSRFGRQTVTSITICKTCVQRKIITKKRPPLFCKPAMRNCCKHQTKEARMCIELKKLKTELNRKKILIEKYKAVAHFETVDQSVQCNMTQAISRNKADTETDNQRKARSVHIISNILVAHKPNQSINDDDSIILPTPYNCEKKIPSNVDLKVKKQAVPKINRKTGEIVEHIVKSQCYLDGEENFTQILQNINDNLEKDDVWKVNEEERSLLSLSFDNNIKKSASFQEYKRQFLKSQSSIDNYFAKLSLENIFETNFGAAKTTDSFLLRKFNQRFDIRTENEVARDVCEIPKGFSQGLIATPQIDGTVSSEVMQQFYDAVCESYNDELANIKWKKHYLQNTDPFTFFENIYDKRFCVAATDLNLPKTRKGFANVRLCKEMLQQLDILGQYDKKFIITIWPLQNLIVIFDQHAVHERVRFEQLFKETLQIKLYVDYRNEESGNFIAKSVNNFEIPLSLSTIQQCEKHSKVFQRFGFEWTHLPSYQMSSIPKCVFNRMKRDIGSHNRHSELIKSIILEILQCLESGGLAPKWIPATLRDVINSEACRGAIMFGDVMTVEDCHRHISDLSKCTFPFVCVHGRPTCTPLIEIVDNEKTLKMVNLKRLCGSNTKAANAK